MKCKIKVILILLMLCLTYSPLSFSRPLIIGAIANLQSPDVNIKNYDALAAYISKKLQAFGIDGSEVKVVPTLPELADLMTQRKIDLFFGSPYSALKIAARTNGKIFLTGWMQGEENYYGLLFTKQNSAIKTVNDLKGKIIAFEYPSSTSSYFLPKMTLLNSGYKLTQINNLSDQVNKDEIGYFFSANQTNTILLVRNDKVAAGAINPADLDNYQHRYHETFKIILKTLTVPRYLVMYQENLPPTLINKIKEILITMDQTPEGRNILKNFENMSRFADLSKIDQQQLIILMNMIKHHSNND